MECLKCKHDLDHLYGVYDLINTKIICPTCSCEMILEYDEYWEEEMEEEEQWWWLELYDKYNEN